jgi:hypothetical protein
MRDNIYIYCLEIARFCGLRSDLFTNISQLGAHISCLYTQNSTLNYRNKWERRRRRRRSLDYTVMPHLGLASVTSVERH